MRRSDSLPLRVLTFACFVLVALLLPACRIPLRPSPKLTITVDVSPQANNNNPVAVDLILVKDKKLFKEMMKVTAAEWFEKREQFRLDYPKETGLSAGSWEWVPGQKVVIEPLPLKFKSAGGLVFANYFTPGAHRAVIKPGKPFQLTLGPEDLTVKIEK
ncbi:MAG: type secretion system protein [Pyrinomonadaceae bacterium]|jgi:type VI secretion system protein|nr:type secretion system protein [Pyrinomonadaceae bacterium]